MFDDVGGPADSVAAQALAEAVAARRQVAYHQAVELEQLARFARNYPDEEFAHLEVAALLGISDRAAQARLHLARTLTARLPDTLTALKSGQIDEYKARLIADAVLLLSDEHTAAVEERVLARAGSQTPTQVRRALSRAVLAVDPAGAEQRRQHRTGERCVTSQATEDGHAILTVFHSADRIAAMHQAITTKARETKAAGGDQRTLAQIEADLAVELILGKGCARRSVEVHVTVAATTLAGLDDQPGEIDGIGPITASTARELANDAARWRWIRTDPTTGQARDLTHARYQPPDSLAELIRVRDRTCRFPGCARPARRTDLDHTRPWPTGPTTDANLGSLCRRHHRAKHEGRWHLTQPAPGHFRWTSPLGHTYQIEPEPLTEGHDPPPQPAGQHHSRARRAG